MTPKQKAAQLYNKFYITSTHPNSVLTRQELAKQSALLCVGEIVNALTDYGNGSSFELQNMDREFAYWDAVEKEIEQL